MTVPLQMKKEVQRLYEKHVRKRGVVVGSLMQAMYSKGGLPRIDWLADNTPDGVTMCEVMAAMAQDAMDEETEYPLAGRPAKAVFVSVRRKP
mgnify:CR=1 FL=1